MKSRPISILLVVAGVLLLLFAWSETAALTEVPGQNAKTTYSGMNVYSFNVSLTGSTILTVINATGSFGLVPEADAGQAATGNISQYSVLPANSTGSSHVNLTYRGLSGKYVFIEQSKSSYAPFLIMSVNGSLSSISGLLVVLSIVMVIGGVFAYPFRSHDVEEQVEKPEEVPPP